MKSYKVTLSLGLALLAACASAQESTPVQADPYVPPAKRIPSAEKPATGAALQNQAMAKLRKRFEEADLDASGSLTLDEAQRAGLGYVAANFAQIDATGSGKVSFQDLRAYMAKRRAEAGPAK